MKSRKTKQKTTIKPTTKKQTNNQEQQTTTTHDPYIPGKLSSYS